MNKRSIFSSIFLVLFVFAFNAKAQIKIDFKEFTLDNGLQVILHQDNSTPIVAVNLTYHVGSKNEKPDRTGFAHFFEHLLFEGTENIGRGEFMNKITAIGGTLNAGTSKDYTTYYEIVPSNHLETALYMESERMLHAKIDEVGIATQRSVIKEEKSETQDNRPYGTIVKEIFERTHQVHPYNWTVIGESEHLDAATHAEFMDFYKTFYVPNNAVLVVAGDIDYAEAERLIKKYFSEIPRGSKEIVRPSATEPKRTAEIRDIIYDNIQLPAVVQAFNIPPMIHEDIPALEMLATYLSGGSSSLLNRELVEKQQKALGVFAIPFALEDGGVFIMYGISNMGVTADDLENSLNEQIQIVMKNGLNDLDFQKLKAQVEAAEVNKLGSMAGLASELGMTKIFYKDANLINTKIEKYNQVTKEDIKRVANQYLGEQGRVVLHYLPKPQEGN